MLRHFFNFFILFSSFVNLGKARLFSTEIKNIYTKALLGFHIGEIANKQITEITV